MKIRALCAEIVGTFMLMSSVLGAALFSFPNAGILGVALSIGLTVMALAFAIGHVSGGHYNPAVTLGLVVGGRFSVADAAPYVIAQCVGAIASCVVFYIVATGKADLVSLGNFASNGYGTQSPGKYGLVSVFLLETVLTAFFLVIIMGVTSQRAPVGFAPIAIGLTLTAIHLMAIPVSNASVNPARSLATAIFGGSEALQQVWLFWVAPILGGALGGLLGRWLLDETA